MHTIHHVYEFHSVFKHPIAPVPTVPDAKTRMLRFRLLLEEVLEFGRAIGVRPLCDDDEEQFRKLLAEALKQFELDPDFPVNLVQAADALADIDYVCQGANLVFGFPAEVIGYTVHQANMSKLGPDGKPIYDENGKVVKGPNTYSPEPRIAEILDEALLRDPV